MITKKQLKALRWAVNEAAVWRGCLTGGDQEVLDEFDESIAQAKMALKALKAELKTPQRDAFDAFEAWARSNLPYPDYTLHADDTCAYADYAVHCAWLAWQAAKSS